MLSEVSRSSTLARVEDLGPRRRPYRPRTEFSVDTVFLERLWYGCEESHNKEYGDVHSKESQLPSRESYRALSSMPIAAAV